jgi:hypothetical protein
LQKSLFGQFGAGDAFDAKSGLRRLQDPVNFPGRPPSSLPFVTPPLTSGTFFVPDSLLILVTFSFWQTLPFSVIF